MNRHLIACLIAIVTSETQNSPSYHLGIKLQKHKKTTWLRLSNLIFQHVFKFINTFIYHRLFSILYYLKLHFDLKSSQNQRVGNKLRPKHYTKNNEALWEIASLKDALLITSRTSTTRFVSWWNTIERLRGKREWKAQVRTNREHPIQHCSV